MDVRDFVTLVMSVLVIMAGSGMPIAAQNSSDSPSLTEQRSHYCGNEAIFNFRWRALEKNLCVEVPELQKLANDRRLSGLVDDFMLAQGNVLLKNRQPTKALLVFQGTKGDTLCNLLWVIT